MFRGEISAFCLSTRLYASCQQFTFVKKLALLEHLKYYEIQFYAKEVCEKNW